MSAYKSGNNIVIDTEPITLSGVVDDIADTSYIEEVSSGVFEIKGNRYLMIQNAGELIIGNSSDYSVSETLQLSPTSNGGSRLYIYHNSTLSMYGNSEFKGTTNSYYSYTYCYGKLYVRGNDTYKPRFSKIYNWRFLYTPSIEGSYEHDIWDIDKAVVADPFNISSYPFQLESNMLHMPVMSFKNIIFDMYEGAVAGEYGCNSCMYLRYDITGDFDKIVFDTCTFRHSLYGIFMYYGSIPYFKNCTFEENHTYAFYSLGHPNTNNYQETIYTVAGNKIAGAEGQRFIFCDNCTFDKNYWDTAVGSRRCVLAYNGSRILFRDCDFYYTDYRSIWNGNGGLTYLWGDTNTFHDGGLAYYNYGGAVYHVQGLDLTVLDPSGNPVDDADVIIRQSQGKELLQFRTTTNGKVKTMYSLNQVIVLVHRIWTDTAGSTEYWSDSSNNTYHEIVVSKPEYGKIIRNIVMDQDRSVTMRFCDFSGF
ncbi:hypothetical protein GF373_17470 [bacterium]|nr:hypothetical protein [bacterium]